MALTLKEFVDKYNGQKVDYDGAFGYQCVDLYRQYCLKVLEIPQSPSVPGAADIWNNYLTKYFNKIPNTPDGIPQPGDVVIWDRNMGGGNGHVAINLEADVNRMKVFEQDGLTQDGAKIKTRPYTHVLGWLRSKAGIIDDMIPDWLFNLFLAETKIDLNKPEGEVREKLAILFGNAKRFTELEKKVKKLEKALAGSAAEAAEWETRYMTQESSLKDIREELERSRGVISKREEEIDKLNIKTNSLTQDIEILKQEIEELKKNQEGGENMPDKNALWEAFKDPLRLLVLAIIPFAIAYFTELNYEWAAMAVLVLKFIDKWLHEIGKQKDNALITGLTRF